MTRDEERAIEWDCQKVLRQYFRHVDQREYEAVGELFTEDAHWQAQDVVLKGRDEIVKALYPALSKGTIRHVYTNTIINAVDEDHAEVRSYNSIYYSAGGRIEDNQGPLPFDAPHRIVNGQVSMVRTADGWRIASLDSQTIFRRNPTEPIALETWAEDESKGSGRDA